MENDEFKKHSKQKIVNLLTKGRKIRSIWGQHAWWVAFLPQHDVHMDRRDVKTSFSCSTHDYYLFQYPEIVARRCDFHDTVNHEEWNT